MNEGEREKVRGGGREVFVAKRIRMVLRCGNDTFKINKSIKTERSIVSACWIVDKLMGYRSSKHYESLILIYNKSKRSLLGKQKNISYFQNFQKKKHWQFSIIFDREVLRYTLGFAKKCVCINYTKMLSRDKLDKMGKSE